MVQKPPEPLRTLRNLLEQCRNCWIPEPKSGIANPENSIAPPRSLQKVREAGRTFWNLPRERENHPEPDRSLWKLPEAYVIVAIYSRVD